MASRQSHVPLGALLLLAAVCSSAALCTTNPPIVVNAVWPSSCRNATAGLVCTAVCNAGYGGPGPVNSTCQPDNTWGPAYGSCNKVCEGPPGPAPGVIWPASCDSTISPGKRCAGMCNSGLNGNPSIACGGAGWDISSMVGKCSVGTVCSIRPPLLVNGRWPTECLDTSAGQYCTAVCNPGYGPGAKSQCGATGTWGTVEGMCARVCVDPPPAVSGLTWPATCAGGTPVGSRCQGQCAPGTSGNPTIMCVGGNWDLSSMVGRCNVGGGCSARPPPLVNTVWPVSCIDTAAGSTCVGTCRPGYGPGASAVCNQDGTWTTSGSCYKVCDGLPPDVPGVSWANCANTRVGRRCTGTCNSGLSGTPSMMCTGQGWDIVTMYGRCNAGSVCSAPFPTLINGVWPLTCLDITAGSGCIAACNPGYGPGASITCGTGGVWSAVTGSCSRVCVGLPPPATGVTWPTTCDGTVKPGGRCTGSCASGMSGTPSIVCTGQGWEPTSMLGKCVTGTACSAPFPMLVNGVWPASCYDSPLGSTCVAACNMGYNTPGAYISCGAAGVWSAVVGSCSKDRSS